MWENTSSFASSHENAPLQMQVTMLDYNDFLGRIGIGRIYRGTMNLNEMVSVTTRDGEVKKMRIQKLFGAYNVTCGEFS